MKWLSFLLLFVLAIGMAGCAKKSSFERIVVTDATYRKIAEIQDPKALAQIESQLLAREVAGKAKDYFYFLEVQSNQGRAFWHYNLDGTGVEIRDGKDFAFFKIKNAEAFNRLIGLEKSP